MTREAPRNRDAIIRRLQATLDQRADDFSITPAFSARVQRLRQRRRVVRQTSRAFAVAAIIVVLAVAAVNALRPTPRIDFVSPTATESPSPSDTSETSEPSETSETSETADTPAPPPSPSETPSQAPSETPSPPASEREGEAEPPPEPPLSADTPINLHGIGPIEAGVTLAEAERAAGVDLVPWNFEGSRGFCYYATAKGLKDDFVMMVRARGSEPVDSPEDGIVVSVSVDHTMASPARTLSGIGIGSTEQDVYDTYPGRIESQPHFYVEGGHYLTYVPRDKSDQDYRVKFATDGQAVLEIHAGFADAVAAVEGCS